MLTAIWVVLVIALIFVIALIISILISLFLAGCGASCPSCGQSGGSGGTGSSGGFRCLTTGVTGTEQDKGVGLERRVASGERFPGRSIFVNGYGPLTTAQITAIQSLPGSNTFGFNVTIDARPNFLSPMGLSGT